MLDRSRSRDRSKTGGAFSPAGLFVTGAQGAWYDPSDFSTLYQNSTGTTPVTAVEQPVRLMLDRSRGLVLGPELVTNGDFSNGGTGWTIGITGSSVVTFASGIASLFRSGGAANINKAILTIGKTYLLVVRMRATTGTVSFRADVSGGAQYSATANTVFTDYSFTVVNAAGATVFFNNLTDASTLEIDNISVRELPGNHATAPNDASRPVLRARYNLLTFSEQFDNAGWTKQRTTVTANAVTAPDGTTTADAVFETVDSGTHGVFQTITKAASATTYAVSCYVKPNGRDWAILQLTGPGETNFVRVWFNLSGSGAVGSNVAAGTGFSFVSASIQSLADGWYRCTTVITGDTATSHTTFVRTATGDTLASYVGDITKGLYIWGASLLTAADQAATGGAYQRVAAATDYDTSNPVWRPYLAFDGSDDSFGTSAIDFSGTDEMTVFAGLTKLSDASFAVLAELSAASASNNGTFGFFAPNPANLYTWRSRGTISQDVNTGNPAYNAPDTSVLTGIGDISGDVSTLRVDGAQAGTSTNDQGAGNFGNYPLFLGRRNNASLPFNGRLYGLTVLGRTATAAEISAMETWINGKTGAY